MLFEIQTGPPKTFLLDTHLHFENLKFFLLPKEDNFKF